MHALIKNKFYSNFVIYSSDEQSFSKDDYIVFGSETNGINESFLKKHWNKTCTIPMKNPNIRSLNLATSVGIVLYEAIRQVNEK